MYTCRSKSNYMFRGKRPMKTLSSPMLLLMHQECRCHNANKEIYTHKITHTHICTCAFRVPLAPGMKFFISVYTNIILYLYTLLQRRGKKYYSSERFRSGMAAFRFGGKLFHFLKILKQYRSGVQKSVTCVTFLKPN